MRRFAESLILARRSLLRKTLPKRKINENKRRLEYEGWNATRLEPADEKLRDWRSRLFRLRENKWTYNNN